MTFLARMLQPRNAVTTSGQLERELMLARSTDSGAIITDDSAMTISDVWAAVRVLSEDIAQLPIIIYRRTPDGKERARDHWLYRLLHDTPNPWQTAFEFKEMLQAHATLNGTGYAIKTVVRGEVRELFPVSPRRVTAKQEPYPGWRVSYQVAMPDGAAPLDVPMERMFVLPALSFNGISGISPVSYQREAMALSMQLRRHGSKLFKQGASIRGILSHPGKMSKPAYERLLQTFDEKYAGVDNAHKTLLVEEGVKYEKAAMTSEDAQFLESREFSRNEIAAIFRIPPHMIGDLRRATFTNIEHQGIEYVVHSLGPWFRRWEGAIQRRLIPEAERGDLFAEFLADALLRGDTQTRYAAYHMAIQDRWMDRNEVRERENLNRRPGLEQLDSPAADPAAKAVDGLAAVLRERMQLSTNGNGRH